MNSYIERPALICPYTLIEEEALDWAILLFGQAILLHPYPLSLPGSFQFPLDQGWIQVRSLERTREAIKEKDSLLREFAEYVSNNPGRGFLKYLLETAALEKMETQEEITGLMKGQPIKEPDINSPIVNGPILLCLIHEWMRQEWEVETSLAKIEEQEKMMVQGWQENPEEGLHWESADPVILKRNETEINFLPALAAWRELKKALVPEPVTLVTTQQWVWAEYYGQDPEEVRTRSIPLPELGAYDKAIFQAPLTMGIREKMEAVLRPSTGVDIKGLVDDFQKSLLESGLPPDGKYHLIFPPYPPTLQIPPSPSGKKNSDPLILLLPA